MSAIDYLINSNLSVIFSESNKFMYIKNPKVAGTSINSVLYGVRDVKMPSFNYNNAKEWLRAIDEWTFGEFYKFTFVRNPWDRMVLLWNYFTVKVNCRASIPKCSLKVFLEKEYFKANQSVINHSIPQHTPVMHEDDIFVDFIGRFESIQDDWKVLADKIGVSRKLPVRNRSRNDDYVLHYDDWCINKVSEIYAKDIEVFGYKFGG